MISNQISEQQLSSSSDNIVGLILIASNSDMYFMCRIRAFPCINNAYPYDDELFCRG